MNFAEKQEFDVLIIGGGVIGLSIARELRKNGVERVAIVEKHSACGMGASFVAAGMLAPQVEADSFDDFFRLCQQSRDLYPNFAAELYAQTKFDVELEQTGTLYLAFNEKDLSELENRFAWQRVANLPVEKLTTKEVLDLEPNVSSQVLGALRFPLDWQVNTRRLIESLNKNLQGFGLNKFMQRNYLDKSRDRDGGEFISRTVTSLQFEEDKEIIIKTERETFSASFVVIASGAWTSLLNLPENIKLNAEIEPIRGQIMSFRHTELFKHVIYTPRGYVVPRMYAEILVGATVERAGFDSYPTGAGVSLLLQTAFEISPKFPNLSFKKMSVGLRPKSPDGWPLLGEYPADSGLYFATGHYRNGILLAPITAKILADKIVNNTDSPFLKIFNPSRFVNHS